ARVMVRRRGVGQGALRGHRGRLPGVACRIRRPRLDTCNPSRAQLRQVRRTSVGHRGGTAAPMRTPSEINLSADDLLALYRRMLLIRRVEERLGEDFKRGDLPG